MAVVADSGAVYGLYDRRDAAHKALRVTVEELRTRLVIPSTSLGEIDYLIRTRLGNAALLRFLADVQEGAFVIESVMLADLRHCASLIRKFADRDLGLSDAAVIAVAERLATNLILTVDLRDFRRIRSSQGKPFRLLPADRAKK